MKDGKVCGYGQNLCEYDLGRISRSRIFVQFVCLLD